MIRVLVTRPRAQAASLDDALARAGIETIDVPTVAIEPPADGSLGQALQDIARFDWLIVTSANAVPALAERVPPRMRVAAVGPRTATALREAGIRVDHVPRRFVSTAIADGLGDIRGRHVLLARSDIATPALGRALSARGAHLTEAIAYRTLDGPPSSAAALHAAMASRIDGIVFCSASAVRGLLALASNDERPRWLRLPALCIGPVTAAEARAAGFEVAVVASRHTGIGLAEAIVDHFSTEAIA